MTPDWCIVKERLTNSTQQHSMSDVCHLFPQYCQNMLYFCHIKPPNPDFNIYSSPYQRCTGVKLCLVLQHKAFKKRHKKKPQSFKFQISSTLFIYKKVNRNYLETCMLHLAHNVLLPWNKLQFLTSASIWWWMVISSFSSILQRALQMYKWILHTKDVLLHYRSLFLWIKYDCYFHFLFAFWKVFLEINLHNTVFI
jgi:hypothetical protein